MGPVHPYPRLPAFVYPRDARLPRGFRFGTVNGYR